MEADIEEDHVLEVMEEDEKMYFEADIEEDHVLEVKEEDEKMYLEADIGRYSTTNTKQLILMLMMLI